MANTITKCIEYINNADTYLGMYREESLTNDLVKTFLEHKGNTVSYQQVSFGSGAIASYSRTAGYTARDISLTRSTKELTQDIGDKLQLDTMDNEEAQADGIVSLYSRYVRKIQIPAVDTYRFAQVLANSKTNGTNTVRASVTKANIVASLLEDRKALLNKKIKFEECVIYISVSDMALLEEACYEKGLIMVGSWNGSVDAEVKMFQGAKLVAVPDTEISAHWEIVHPLAVDAFVVHQEAVYFDRVPGFGTRMTELDLGIYHDCWIAPEGKDGVVTCSAE